MVTRFTGRLAEAEGVAEGGGTVFELDDALGSGIS